MYLNAMAKTPTAVKLCEWEMGNYWKGYAVKLLLLHVFPLIKQHVTEGFNANSQT